MDDFYDVVVIGSGPSGSTASTLLAQKGFKVAMLEQKRHPMPKVGESLLPHFWKYTDLLGVSDKIRQAGFLEKSGGVVNWNGQMRSTSFKELGYATPAYHAERDEFDQILFENSIEKGVFAFEDTKVDKVDFSNPSNAVVFYTRKQEDEIRRGSVKATYIIDCSGQKAIIGHQEGLRKYDDGFRFQAFWGYLDEMSYIPSLGEVANFSERFNRNPMTLVTNSGDWGWIWQIVLKNKVSVGLVLERKYISNFKLLGSDMKARFMKTLTENELIGPMMGNANLIDDQVFSVKDYSYQSSTYSYQNSLLCGDAAAFVDPINSAGVLMAFYSGLFASWTIARAFKNPKSVKNYFQFYNESIQSRFELFRSIAVPKKNIDDKTLAFCKHSFKSFSKVELNLIVTQLMLIQRGENLSKFLDSLNLDYEPVYDEMSLEEYLS